MPLTIYPSTLKIKDSNGTFHSANCIKGDTGPQGDDYVLTVQDKADIAGMIDISGKADKVSNTTSGNFAALDANGNLTDSGHKHSDYLTAHQTIPVTDVQANGVSVVSNGVAVLPVVVTETVTGTDPVITGAANHRYVCGTCDTLSITPPASGEIEVQFTSGTTATVLTLPNTVKMPDWWTGTEASRVYDLIITDGVYGVVTSWSA